MFLCEGTSCDSKFKDESLLFKMKQNNVYGLFCFGCVTQLHKSEGWEMKSREALAKYKKITGEDYAPYDSIMQNDPPSPEDTDS